MREKGERREREGRIKGEGEGREKGERPKEEGRKSESEGLIRREGMVTYQCSLYLVVI